MLMLKMEPGPGRQPGVACNKHQGRERKPQQYLFKTPSFTTCIKQQRQNKVKQGFLAILNDQRWLLNTGLLKTYANMTGSTAPRRQTFAQHLPTLLPSHPKLRQTKQIQRLKALGRLTADVHHKHCSKQTCTKRARPQSDC